MFNILVIDDSSDYRALLKQLIVSNYPNAQVEEYDPDMKGIPEKSRNWKEVSMVLLDYDLGLENENGLDWLQIMMTYPDMPPIVILTTETSRTTTVRALKLGAANYLLKTDINSDNIVSIFTESFELAGLNQESSMSTSKHGDNLNDGAMFDLTAMPALENILTEETQAPDFVDISDDNEPHIIIPGYSILKEIAKGGMSTVLLAKRLEDNLDVVLKVLFTKGLEDSSGLKRFIQEYDLISAMNHPHIIRIYERAFASEFAYIALEYLPQGDLSKRILDGISTETAMSYLRQIALGLGAIHKLNIIHRDLKPGNILFHDDGRLIITDFGTAKIISDKMKEITMNNMVVGTPYYMSPEQCSGMKLDRRSDIYSLGVLFYLMLTGKKLFTANSISMLIQAHINDPIPELPAELSKYQPLIEGMLAKDPDERFQIVDELIAGIDWIEQS